MMLIRESPPPLPHLVTSAAFFSAAAVYIGCAQEMPWCAFERNP